MATEEGEGEEGEAGGQGAKITAGGRTAPRCRGVGPRTRAPPCTAGRDGAGGGHVGG
jgi:hypothetical protein